MSFFIQTTVINTFHSPLCDVSTSVRCCLTLYLSFISANQTAPINSIDDKNKAFLKLGIHVVISIIGISLLSQRLTAHSLGDY